MVKKKKQKVRFHKGDRKPGPALTRETKIQSRDGQRRKKDTLACR